VVVLMDAANGNVLWWKVVSSGGGDDMISLGGLTFDPNLSPQVRDSQRVMRVRVVV